MSETKLMLLSNGVREGYRWFTTEQEFEAFLRLNPEVIIHKYVVVTSIDSGVLQLTESQRHKGWKVVHGIAYSPLVEAIEDLPRGGFDEWYIFDKPMNLGQLFRGNLFEATIQPGHMAVFVNYFGCLLHDKELESLADLFWKQLSWVQPESYISDGNSCLTFVTRNAGLFDAVRQRTDKAVEGSANQSA